MSNSSRAYIDDVHTVTSFPPMATAAAWNAEYVLLPLDGALIELKTNVYENGDLSIA